MGQLIPTTWWECYPGDEYRLSSSSLIRFQPLIAPVMHRVDVYQHWFFVPYRIMWDGFEQWLRSMTVIPDDPPADPIIFPYFTITMDAGIQGSLSDYLGIPPGSLTNTVDVQGMPYSAYYKIWFDYYGDENLAPAANPNDISWRLSDGDNTGRTEFYGLRRRAWQKDYFTAALPWAQKGPTVNLPVGTLEDVRVFRNHSSPYTTTLTGSPDNQIVAGRPSTNTDVGADNLYANTENMELTGTSINDWRNALRLQEFLERLARGGTRLTEMIRSIFGVTPPDYRLQRAEYICGARNQVIVSEVLNTTGTDDAPQGAMAGHGIAAGSGNMGKFFCQEHGIIMSIMSVLPVPAYMQGINSQFLRKGDPLEAMMWPQFGNLGEQEIKQVEIFADDTVIGQAITFGYIPRFAQYKYMPNRVSGEFRSTLKFWTFVREFTEAPTLSQEFIECVPTKDPFAVIDAEEDSLLAHVFHKVSAKRPMPKFGVPST